MSIIISKRAALGGAAAATLSLLASKRFAICSAAGADTLANQGLQTSAHGFHFGWVRGLPNRNFQQYVTRPSGTLPPNTVDLRAMMPPVYDQQRIGSCVANALAAAIDYARRKAGNTPNFSPSRLLIYYYGRLIEGVVANDSGMQVQDGITAVEKYGVCSETDWPYDGTPADKEGHFLSTSKAIIVPRSGIQNVAYPFRVLGARAISQTEEGCIFCLASGYPFIFGFMIYESFFDKQKRPVSRVAVPTQNAQPYGAHAVLAVGYDQRQRMFICRNSWGTRDKSGPIQDKGYFYIPYDYVLDRELASDFWTIQNTESFIEIGRTGSKP